MQFSLTIKKELLITALEAHLGARLATTYAHQVRESLEAAINALCEGNLTSVLRDSIRVETRDEDKPMWTVKISAPNGKDAKLGLEAFNSIIRPFSQ